MDSRVFTGHHASTSRLLERSATYQRCPGKLVRNPTECDDRSRGSPCRSVFDSSAGFPSRSFPTTDITGQDWRAFRAHLVAWEHSSRRAAEQTQQLRRPPYPPLVSGESWAHPLAEPEPGCLLLARQDNMKFFTGSVILITSHDEHSGSAGYVLNKPSPLTVEQLQVLGAASGFKEAFSSQRVHLGGPLHLDHVTLLHRFVGIRRGQKIADGMFMGGLADAIRLVTAGLLRPSDFHLVLGMSAWLPGQLRTEVADGFWHVISASPDLMLPAGAEPLTCAVAAAAAMSASSPPPPPSSASSASSSAAAASSCGPQAIAAATASSQQRQRQQRNEQQQQQQRSEGRGACGGEAAGGGASGSSGGGKGGGKRRGAAVVSPMYRRIARLAVRGA